MGKLGVQGFDSRTFMVCRGWQYRRYASIQAGISLGLWDCLTLWTLVASGVTPYNKSVFILPGQDQPRPPFPGKTKNTHALFTQTQAAVQNQVHARPSQQKRKTWWNPVIRVQKIRVCVLKHEHVQSQDWFCWSAPVLSPLNHYIKTDRLRCIYGEGWETEYLQNSDNDFAHEVSYNEPIFRLVLWLWWVLKHCFKILYFELY